MQRTKNGKGPVYKKSGHAVGASTETREASLEGFVEGTRKLAWLRGRDYRDSQTLPNKKSRADGEALRDPYDNDTRTERDDYNAFLKKVETRQAETEALHRWLYEQEKALQLDAHTRDVLREEAYSKRWVPPVEESSGESGKSSTPARASPVSLSRDEHSVLRCVVDSDMLPSQMTIAENNDEGVSIRTVAKALARLEKIGFVERPRGFKGGYGATALGSEWLQARAKSTQT